MVIRYCGIWPNCSQPGRWCLLGAHIAKSNQTAATNLPYSPQNRPVLWNARSKTGVYRWRKQALKRSVRRRLCLKSDTTGRDCFFESPLHVPSFFVNDKPHNVGLNFIVLSNMLCLDANIVREDRLRGHGKSCSETRGPRVLIGSSISIGPDLRNLFHFRLGFKSSESSQGPNRC